ncbi:MAG: molybdopterin cofactor-binding domain-containing protein, partial [Myxococcota bacterium]
ELDADWARVRAEHAPADAARYGFQLTAGSSSIRNNYQTMRTAGATARHLLVEAAAQTLEVPAGELRTEDSSVYHDATGRQMRYGDLAALAATLPVPDEVPLKDPAQFTLIGTPVKRLDSASKADGTAIFGFDVTVANMAVAQVARAPVFGDTLASFDASAALEVSGVQDVVELPAGVGVAVVADHFWAAQKGRQALDITWTAGPNRNLDSAAIFSTMRAVVDSGVDIVSRGDADGAIAAAGQNLVVDYQLPYLAHAPMEPLNCTADVRADSCEIWAPTQSPSITQSVAAQLTGLSPDQITVHTTFMGGGFGRRGSTDFVSDAVAASMAVGRPVKVAYTREDDVQGGQYRPAVFGTISGAIDESGLPSAWLHKIVTPPIFLFIDQETGIDFSVHEGASNLPYGIDDFRVTYCDPQLTPAIQPWFWRSVGASQNAFITESFFDELADLGGRDPLEARLALLADHPRHRRALEAAAERAGWGQALPGGRAHGVAVHESFGTVVAEIAEISVASTGDLRVHRVVAAVDCGQVINPDTVEAQIEGSIVYGLSAALWGEISIDGGRAVQSNFHNYRIMRMREMPIIETLIIAEGDPIGGIGEPGLPPIAPAVCNALYSLSGTRIRQLPVGTLSA